MSTDDLPRIIGLTGGIASGKSTVSDMLRRRGAVVIDADLIAREVVEPGQPALDEIRARFGDSMIRAGGGLDRARLGQRVFSDPDARAALNAITHPRIAERMLERARQARAEGHTWVIYDAALLVENGLHRMLPATIVVAASPETQLQRLMDRDGLDRADAQARIDAQLPLDEKLRIATWVVRNDGTLDDTRRQVDELFLELERIDHE